MAKQANRLYLIINLPVNDISLGFAYMALLDVE